MDVWQWATFAQELVLSWVFSRPTKCFETMLEPLFRKKNMWTYVHKRGGVRKPTVPVGATPSLLGSPTKSAFTES